MSDQKKDPSAKGVSKLVGFQSAPPFGGDGGHLSTGAGQSQASVATIGGAGAAEVGRAPARTASGPSAFPCLSCFNSIEDPLNSRINGKSFEAELASCKRDWLRDHPREARQEQAHNLLRAYGSVVEAIRADDPEGYCTDYAAAEKRFLQDLCPVDSASRKRATALGENAKALIESVGLERVGFVTLTFPDKPSVAEGQRRLNSLMNNHGRQWFARFICVGEMQVRGVVHYHFLADLGFDLRTGFDFEAVGRGDYRSACPELRGLWREMREILPRYGFGRSELMPIKSSLEAAARYVGKYLSKGDANAVVGGVRWPKGARRLRYSQRGAWRVWKSPHCFAWRSHGGEVWRSIVAGVADELGCRDMDELRDKLGPRWAWRLQQIFKADPECTCVEAAWRLLPS